jgi:hypothetical protein
MSGGRRKTIEYLVKHRREHMMILSIFYSLINANIESDNTERDDRMILIYKVFDYIISTLSTLSLNNKYYISNSF